MRIEHWRYRIPHWLRGLFRRRDVERDLDDEIRDHIERQTAANVAAGMSADEARRAALVKFGGIERIKDESRDVRRLSIIDSIAQLRYAARSLWRARTFTVATITTIALGTGAGCAVFTLVNSVLLQPLPYPDSDRLVGLWHAFPGMNMPAVRQSPGTYVSYRTLAKSFESVGAYSDEISATVTYADPGVAPERVPMARVAGSIFAMLRTRPAMGRLIVDADEQPGAPPVVVIGESFWRERLNGTPAVLGQRLRVDGVDREIVGVLPASFAFPTADARLWVPTGAGRPVYLGSFTFRALGRLRPGVSPDAAQKELNDILTRIPETYPEQRPGVSTAKILAQVKAVALVHPMREDVVGDFDRILWLVAATVALLVIVSFSNVASLLLARVEARRWEFAVRSVLGASTLRVWWSLAAEAAIVSVVGGIPGLAIANGAIEFLVHAGPPDLPRLNEVRAGWPLVIPVAGLTTLFCVMSALIGTWRLRSGGTARVLSDGGRFRTANRASQRMRAAFVMAEVALALVLLSGSAVLARSFMRLRAVQPGFDARNAFTLWTDLPGKPYDTAAEVSRFYTNAVDRIAQLPGVESVGIVSKLPLVGGQTMRIIWVEGRTRPEDPLPPAFVVTEASRGYFSAMRIPLLSGRSFDAAHVSRGVNEVVVSRGFASRYWNDSTGRQALGQRVRPYQDDPNWYTIVGVVGDVRDTSLTESPSSMLYFPAQAGPDSTADWRMSSEMAFVVRTRGHAPSLPAMVVREIHALDRTLPVYGAENLEDTVTKAGSRMTFALLLLTAGATATLALGIVGLYGVIAYVVGMRSREIGIRIALGLLPERAVRMILRQGEAIIVTGAVVGLLVFLGFAKLLRSLAFEVSVVDSASLAAAGTIVVVVASVATWVAARGAARIDPIEALKND